MYRRPLRTASASLARSAYKRPAPRRFLTTAPPHQTSRSWKNSAIRWGLAGTLLYYYNTSNAFAEEPAYSVHSPPETSRETESYPSIDSIAEQRKAQARDPAASSPAQSASVAAPDAAGAIPGSPEDLEQEAGEQGAFNEETGEINWDCPCLGGMAHGPCGDQFRAAFSCFVYSKDEPKGVDCIEHFKTMQNCFRDHPDVYGAELEDEDAPLPEGAEGELVPATPHPAPLEPQPIPTPTPEDSKVPTLANASRPGGAEKVAIHSTGQPDTNEAVAGKRERAEAATKQVQQDHGPVSESPAMMPRAAHDAR
ncbi:Oxidoreductase [Friedmanniomyces endolithicus]|uniref:Mitochondrial intermembrane space import and assembly protein 40 n=1 Tax=Friedmanniomyces endolithicus TaxID=329885 RepID=A0AAN6QJC5_9PEZI|nr:Oxidoreductase [Friedmanniomyces endolithicus]KAK0776756.1 Oxidoreductase [Friedmanniomyces endolithicus]KAK0790928.1 Oxidoreductase [Friedmanniomyces endolithicus]KAK0794961.1 Oxidoreductase [Friedmanniomyces endolithicus]KAK0840260.1 Oxidoreductase [Friedmanniomyces endolithicus]